MNIMCNQIYPKDHVQNPNKQWNFYNDTCLASGLCHRRRRLKKWADLVQRNWHLINLNGWFLPIFPSRWLFLGWILLSLWRVWIHPSRLTQFGIIHAYLQFTEVVNMGKQLKQTIQAISEAYRGWIPPFIQLNSDHSISTLPTRRIWPPLWDVSSLVTMIRGHNITNPNNALLFSGNSSKSAYIYIVWSLPHGSHLMTLGDSDVFICF